MHWLLGGGVVAAILAMAGSIYAIILLARKSREDLLRLAEVSHELDESRLLKERTERALGDRDAAIQTLQNALANEKAAKQSVEGHLSSLLEELAKSGNSAGAGERIRRSLRLLEQMSPVPGGAAAERGDGATPLHGVSAARPGAAGQGDKLPGPGGRET